MKNWEEAGLLTDLLDRHVERIVHATATTDWSIYWMLPPLLQLIETEPALADIIGDYVEGVERIGREQARRCCGLAKHAADFLGKHGELLDAIKKGIPQSKLEGLGIDTVSADLAAVTESPPNPSRLEKALNALHQWIGFAGNDQDESAVDAKLDQARVQIARLRNAFRKLALRSERLEASHPGHAYLRLRQRLEDVDYSATDDSLADAVHNEHAEKIHKWIRAAEDWGGAADTLAQPAIINIQKDIRTLHLGLVTALARGRSRWGIVRRFGARCETFGRNALLAELQQGARKPEAVLTLAFAQFLFDAGLNPLVDAAACGLRPDLLDATSEPAVYVEAKQYENIGEAFLTAVKADLAQTMNTWDRLAKRWLVPEAFLVIFRRSGRPLALENVEARHRGRRLYVLDVDLAAASESGSRSSEPVRVDIQALLGTAAPAGPEGDL